MFTMVHNTRRVMCTLKCVISQFAMAFAITLLTFQHLCNIAHWENRASLQVGYHEVNHTN